MVVTLKEIEVYLLTSTPKQNFSGEPNHTPGHDPAVVAVNEDRYMCPECGKTFTIEDAAVQHLHGIHLEHLRKEHQEFHNKDVVGHHIS
jgi:transposase-like protein